MAEELQGMRIAFLVANEGIEQIELTEPWDAVSEAGGIAELIAPECGKAQAMNHLDRADTFAVDRTTGEISAVEYDAVVLPGGVANADALRMDQPAVTFVRRMFEAGKPCAVICHGPWALVEAGVVRGRTLTSWPSLKTDIRNAAGIWVDAEVQVCTSGPNVIVSSRKPDDLPAFCAKMTEVFEQSRQVSSARG
ncbi:MAG: protease [Acidimicrobiaceae bacterium]|jgi:protease I|nr:protease [Acidimicrobiaceae bacterium]